MPPTWQRSWVASTSARRWTGSSRACAAGQSRVLVLRGEAGVGKTALLEHLAAAATGCRVARAAGVESEMELPFAGLHSCARRCSTGCARLPGPQRDALGTAFGLDAGPAAGPVPGRAGGAEPARRRGRGAAAGLHRRRRAVARPGVGADAGVRRPPAAGRAGRAGVRRARAEARSTRLAGLPELDGRGPRRRSTRALLLDAAIPGPLDERVRDRILAEARGNPLALLELPRGLTPASWPAASGCPARCR